MSAQFDQIQSTFDHFAKTWNANNGAALARCFVEDGALINPFGERADGQTAIGAMYSQYFGSMLRGTSTVVKLSNVRSVEAGHAFADGEQTIHGPDGSVVLSVHIAALLRRGADEWRIVDARPYTFASMRA